MGSCWEEGGYFIRRELYPFSLLHTILRRAQKSWGLIALLLPQTQRQALGTQFSDVESFAGFKKYGMECLLICMLTKFVDVILCCGKGRSLSSHFLLKKYVAEMNTSKVFNK